MIPLLTTEIRSEYDLMLTRQRARQIAELLGFEAQDQTRISTAVSEIARNALQFAGAGKVEFQLTPGAVQGFQVVIRDKGPGIANVDRLLDMSETSPLATGRTLRGVCRLMDVFDVDSAAGRGTCVTLCKLRPRWLPAIERKEIGNLMTALMQHAMEGPLAEIQRQNHELLQALEELRLQEEERRHHLQEIEQLNARLQRSVQATHHRVKNNLQIISALVEIQMAEENATVSAAAMRRIGQHARALAAIHDLLTEETRFDAAIEAVSAHSIMGRLMPLLQATTGGRPISFHSDDFPLPIREGASLALLVSELVSNAVKHGHDTIEVELKVQGDHAMLTVCDDGPGFPPDFNWVQAANTGLCLIDSTGRHDLRGTIAYENHPHGGARVVVCFPIQALSPAFRYEHP